MTNHRGYSCTCNQFTHFRNRPKKRTIFRRTPLLLVPHPHPPCSSTRGTTSFLGCVSHFRHFRLHACPIWRHPQRILTLFPTPTRVAHVQRKSTTTTPRTPFARRFSNKKKKNGDQAKKTARISRRRYPRTFFFLQMCEKTGFVYIQK